MRAIIYTRQSVAKEETISHEIQESACRQYAASKGYDVLRVETDPGISGLNLAKRRALARSVESIQNGEAEVLLVWRWSRLSRRQFDQAFLLDQIEKAGGRVESALEPVAATAAGEFGRDVMLAVASFESKQKSETWIQTHQRRADMGLPTHGHKYFGYIKKTSGYELDEETAPFLREAYKNYVSGLGFKTIAAHLNEDSATAIRYEKKLNDGSLVEETIKKHWDKDTLRKAMDNPFNAGKISRRGELLDGAHEAVITEPLWQAYQRARQKNAGTAPRTASSNWWLAGLVKCELCGGAMGKNTGSSGVVYLMCNRQRKGGNCKGVTVLLEHVDWVGMLWLGSHMEAWASVLPSDDKAKHAAEDAATSAQHAVDLARADISNLQLMAIRQGWKDEEVSAAYAVLKDDLDKATAELEEAHATLGSFIPASDVMEKVKRGLQLKGWWHDEEQKSENEAREWKALVAQIIKEVKCSPKEGSEFGYEQIQVIGRETRII